MFLELFEVKRQFFECFFDVVRSSYRANMHCSQNDIIAMMNANETALETKPNEPARPRRWWRYSLRTLVVVVTLFCIWIGVLANRARTQKLTLEKLTRLGANNILFDYQIESTTTDEGVTFKREQPHPLPKRVTNLIGEE